MEIDKWQQMGIGVAFMMFMAFIAVRERMRRGKTTVTPAEPGDADAKASSSTADATPPADTTAQVVVAAVASPSMPPKADRPKVLPPREQLMLDERERMGTHLCLHCDRLATHGLPYPEPATLRRVGDDITELWRVRPRKRLRLSLFSGHFTDALRDWYDSVDRDALLCAEHYATALMHANRRVHELNAAASKFLTDQNDDAREFQMHVRETLRDEALRVKLGRAKGTS